MKPKAKAKSAVGDSYRILDKHGHPIKTKSKDTFAVPHVVRFDEIKRMAAEAQR